MPLRSPSVWGDLRVASPGSDAAGLTSETSVAQAVAPSGDVTDMRPVADAER